MHGSSSPYRQSSRPPSRAPSPYGRPVENAYEAYQSLPTGHAKVGPGAITYATSTGPDGRTMYHLFKAVAASYQTPTGLISGIQWLPAEVTSTLPPGTILPEHAGFAHKGELESTLAWQRADEKRRKQEEKEARRHREMQSHNTADYELQVARERDAQAQTKREKRKSFIGAAGPPVAVPQAGSTGYPSSPYHGYGNPVPGYAGSGGHGRAASVGSYDVSKHLNDLDLNKGERERKVSIGPSRKYGAKESPYERTRSVSSIHSDRSNPYPSPYSSTTASLYANPKGPYSTSPNMRPSEFPQGFGTAGSTGYPASNHSSSPVPPPLGGYPSNHVLYEPNQPRSRGSSRPASRAASRPPSPNPGPISRSASPSYGRSPHFPTPTMPGEPHQLPAPVAFSRPINAANSFAPFDPVKILDMDEVYDTTSKHPKMPSVLTTHDIWPEDWKRCMQDLARAWTGQLPVAGTGQGRQPPRRSKLAQDLVDLWNNSYYLSRGVELVLFKGTQRRTRSHAGSQQFFLENEDDSSDSMTSNSSDSEHYEVGPYGRPSHVRDDRRREEKRKRRRERKAKRRAYTVYVACIRGPSAPLPAGIPPPGVFPTAMPAGYGPAPYGVPPMGYPLAGYAPPPVGYSASYGTSAGIPTTRSRGHGGGY